MLLSLQSAEPVTREMAATKQRDAAEPNCTKGHVTHPTRLIRTNCERPFLWLSLSSCVFRREGRTKARKWMLASGLGILMLTGSSAFAQGNGKGHGKGNNKHGDADDQGTYYYEHHDQDAILGMV